MAATACPGRHREGRAVLGRAPIHLRRPQRLGRGEAGGAHRGVEAGEGTEQTGGGEAAGDGGTRDEEGEAFGGGVDGGRGDAEEDAEGAADLSLIAEEATESLLPLAAQRGVEIEVDTAADTPRARGSHALLLQLATNLIHNAVVHNLPAGGTVRVTTSAHPSNGGAEPDGVTLTVENTGETLTAERTATLTEPFLRGTTRTHTDQPGVGLGLAIASSIAAAHDATLTLTPRPEGGLRVIVALPSART